MTTVVEGDLKASFSIATTLRCRGVCNSFTWIAPLTLDPYLIMLSVKQGGIKYHFLSLWYDSTWDWTLVSQTIGEHSNQNANGPVTSKTHLSRKNYWLLIQLIIYLKMKCMKLRVMGRGCEFLMLNNTCIYIYIYIYICMCVCVCVCVILEECL